MKGVCARREGDQSTRVHSHVLSRHVNPSANIGPTSKTNRCTLCHAKVGKTGRTSSCRQVHTKVESTRPSIHFVNPVPFPNSNTSTHINLCQYRITLQTKQQQPWISSTRLLVGDRTRTPTSRVKADSNLEADSNPEAVASSVASVTKLTARPAVEESQRRTRTTLTRVRLTVGLRQR